MKQWDDLENQGNPIDTTELCRVLGIDKDDFVRKLIDIKDRSKNPNYSQLLPQKFITQLTPEEAAVIQEVIWKFPGVSLVSRTMRQYTTTNAAHAIGSIGEVSRAVLESEIGSEYRQGDYIGISGVEKQYESILKGRNGLEIFLRDVKGRIQGKYKNGTKDIAPIGGKSLMLSIDIDLQAYGELLMQNKVGSHRRYRTRHGGDTCTCIVAYTRLIDTDRQTTRKKLLHTAGRPLQTATRPPADGTISAGQYIQGSKCTCIRAREYYIDRVAVSVPCGIRSG